MRRVLYVIYACVVIGTYTVVIYSNDGTPRVGGTGYRSGGGSWGGGGWGGGGGGGHK
jgi:hypothetical protein